MPLFVSSLLLPCHSLLLFFFSHHYLPSSSVLLVLFVTLFISSLSKQGNKIPSLLSSSMPPKRKTTAVKRRDNKNQVVATTTSFPHRSLVDRAFTIPNIQRIVQFARTTPKQAIELAYVNRNFQETMKDYHTTHTILFNYCGFPTTEEEDRVLDNYDLKEEISEKYRKVFSLISRLRLPWCLHEIVLRRRSEQYSYLYEECIGFELLAHLDDEDDKLRSTLLGEALIYDTSEDGDWLFTVLDAYQEPAGYPHFEKGNLLRRTLEDDDDRNMSGERRLSPLLWQFIFSHCYAKPWPDLDKVNLMLLIDISADECGRSRNYNPFTKRCVPENAIEYWLLAQPFHHFIEGTPIHKKYEQGSTVLMELMRNPKFSEAILDVFLRRCVKLGCLETVFASRVKMVETDHIDNDELAAEIDYDEVEYPEDRYDYVGEIESDVDSAADNDIDQDNNNTNNNLNEDSVPDDDDDDDDDDDEAWSSFSSSLSSSSSTSTTNDDEERLLVNSDDDDDENQQFITNSDYEILFGSKNALEFAVLAIYDDDEVNEDKIMLLLKYFAKKTTRQFRSKMLKKHGLKWLHMLLKKNLFKPAEYLLVRFFKIIPSSRRSEIGPEFIIVAARCSLASLNLIKKVLRQKSLLESSAIKNQSLLLSVVSYSDVDAECLRDLLNMFSTKSRTILRLSLEDNNNKLLLTAVRKLISADALRLLLKEYADRGILTQALRAPVVDEDASHNNVNNNNNNTNDNKEEKEVVDSVITLARKQIWRHCIETLTRIHDEDLDLLVLHASKAESMMNELSRQCDRHFETLKVLVAHCEKNDIHKNVIPVCNSQVRDLEETLVKTYHFLDEETDDAPASAREMFDLFRCLDRDEYDPRFRWQGETRPSAEEMRVKARKASWGKSVSWYKEKYGEAPAVDKESGKRRKRGE